MFQSLAKTCSVVTSFLNLGGVESGKQLIESLKIKIITMLKTVLHVHACTPNNDVCCCMESPYTIITVSVRQRKNVAVLGAIICDMCLGKVKLYIDKLII